MLHTCNKIQLIIVSETNCLETALSALDLPEAEHVQVRTVPSPSLAPPCPDILIACGSASSLSTLRPQFPSTLIVWHTTPEGLSQSAPGYDIDDFWVSPMREGELAHKYILLLKRLGQRQNHDFYQRAMHAAINNIPDLVWVKDTEGTHLKVNDAFCDCVNKTKDNVEGYGHYHIWDLTQEEYEDSDYVCVDTDAIVTETKKPGAFDELVMSSRGLRQFKTYKSPILNELGELLGTVGIARDVTDLRNIDNKLKIVLDSMPFALVVTDEHDVALHTNPKFESIFNVQSDDILGHVVNISDLVHVISQKPINNNTEEELCVQLDDHTVANIVAQQASILDIFDNVAGNLTIYIDVTRSREMDKKLKEMAYTDALTGLYSRHFLFHTLETSPHSDQIALLSLDLDNFKLANDEFGHMVGDNILKQTAQIIQDAFPNSMAVRFGGDEFIVVHLGETDQENFIQTADALVQTLKHTYQATPQAHKVSCSGGIAFSTPHDAEDFDALQRRSDKALYRAKKKGKNRIEVF